MLFLCAHMRGCSLEQGRICISVAEGIEKASTLPELNDQGIHSSLDALTAIRTDPLIERSFFSTRTPVREYHVV